MSKQEILFIYLEFPNWAQGRSLAYPTQLAMIDALRMAGHKVSSISTCHGLSSEDPGNWLSRISKVFNRQKFDQVWIELVHSNYSESFLEWMKDLAPIRIGLVMESMRYKQNVYDLHPRLEQRHKLVEARLACVTHALFVDEQDAAEARHRGTLESFWWPQTVPKSFVQYISPPVNRDAVFHGSVYGERQSWLEAPCLHGLLLRGNKSLEEESIFPLLFDRLQSATTTALAQQSINFETDHRRFESALMSIRKNIFLLWLQSLKLSMSVVNLPSFFQGFPGRVFEGMAAGRPVISCSVVDRPCTNSLFEDGREILLYDPHSPEHLANQIKRLRVDRGLATRISESANKKLMAYHTTELRVNQIMSWVGRGVRPTYY